MNNNKEVSNLAQEIIELHDRPNFIRLSSLVSDSIKNKKDGWFSKAQYEKVCSAIEQQLGTCESIEYISEIKRNNTLLTLWKARYSSCNYKVLWQIIFDTEQKINSMSINWENI